MRRRLILDICQNEAPHVLYTQKPRVRDLF